MLVEACAHESNVPPWTTRARRVYETWVDRFELLCETQPFADLDEETLVSLARHTRECTFVKDQQIIAAGEPGDALYVIHSGIVRVEAGDRHLAWLGAGDLFGEMALITGEPRQANVFADDPTTCLAIDRVPFYTLLEARPEVAACLTELVGNRLCAGGQIANVGKYRVMHEIGRGGVARVFAGVHPGLRRPVAIKMLDHGLVFDEEFAARFRSEAAIVAGLDHPNIVQIYDHEQAYATEFIVMELLGGSTLAELQRAKGEMDEHAVRRILVQLARALDYAHRRGIVHRDLKPENVMVPPGQPLKLMDFGIAKTIGESTTSDDLIGTAQFMSPEQGRGKAVDGRTDIYALGVMAYEMLTGRVPFDGADPHDIIDAKEAAPAPDVRELRPNVSERIASFVARACERDPEARFPDCAAVLRHLGGHTPLLRPGVRGRTVTLLYDGNEDRAVRDALDRLSADLAGHDVLLTVAEHKTLAEG